MGLLHTIPKRWKPRIKGGRLLAPTGEAITWVAGARLDLSQRAGDLVELPAGLKVRCLELRGCTKLTRLPDGLTVQHLNLDGCTGITSLPEGLRCFELSLKGTRITSLPAGLVVKSRLDLRTVPSWPSCPVGLKVGSLILRGCTGLASLPEGLDVQFLDLQGAARLTGWPEGRASGWAT